MKKRVFIVAGGPSLVGFDFSSLANEDTIVVNSSIFHVPNADYFITMDYTWFLKNGIQFNGHEGEKQDIYNASSAQKFFVVSFSGDRRGVTKHGVTDKKFDLEYDLRLVDRVLYASKHGGIGVTYSDFRCGEDSGYSALQLAILLEYEQIYLLGMDFTVPKAKMQIKDISGSTLRLTPAVSTSSSTIQKIDLSRQTHFFKTMDKAGSGIFAEKLQEYFEFYVETFTEIREKTKSEVFSCSNISLLNNFIDYVSVETALSQV
jgi:hypothetical protein